MSEAVAVKTSLPAKLLSLGILLTIGGAILVAIGFATGGTTMETLGRTVVYGAAPWVILTFGCYGMMLLFHIIRARWGLPILRIFEAGSNTAMLAFFFIVFMAIGYVWGGDVYSMWWNGPVDLNVARKAHFLNRNTFTLLMVIYFGVMIAVGHLLRAWTLKEEASGDKKFNDMRNNLASPGMVLFILIVSFFFTHAFMSIDAHWFSTIYGAWLLIGGAIGAITLGTMIAVSQRDKEPFVGYVDDLMKRDFGNLTLTFTMLWGYFSFSQMLIIWSGNLKEQIPYYLERLQGGLSYIGGALIIGGFLIPFLLMLSPNVKRRPQLLILACGFTFLMRFVDVHWIITPYFRSNAMVPLPELGALLLFGGIWFLIFSTDLAARKGKLVVAAHPYQLTEAQELV